MEKIILASSSPRRRELLTQVGCDFEIVIPDVDETQPEGLSPDKVVLATAKVKCDAVASVYPDRAVLAADTLVAIGDRILGKPASEAEAFEMLRALSGREHTVYTGVAVRRGDACHAQVVATEVRFRKLTEQEIAAYVATGEPMDKAGAYGIQGVGALLVAGIDGDYFNVVGLPLTTSAALLEKLGVRIF